MRSALPHCLRRRGKTLRVCPPNREKITECHSHPMRSALPHNLRRRGKTLRVCPLRRAYAHYTQGTDAPSAYPRDCVHLVCVVRTIIVTSFPVTEMPIIASARH